MPTSPDVSAAASLTYDSGLFEALPLLTALGLRATFYLSAVDLLEQPAVWRQAAATGHEIGAHPLRGVTDGRGNLPNWTMQAVEEDIDACQALFAEILGSPAGSAALHGDELLCTASEEDRRAMSYLPVFESRFATIRGQANGRARGERSGLLPSVPLLSLAQVIQEGERAIAEGSWIIFRIGSIEEEAHAGLCRWLAEHAGKLRQGPVSEIASLDAPLKR